MVFAAESEVLVALALFLDFVAIFLLVPADNSVQTEITQFRRN